MKVALVDEPLENHSVRGKATKVGKKHEQMKESTMENMEEQEPAGKAVVLEISDMANHVSSGKKERVEMKEIVGLQEEKEETEKVKKEQIDYEVQNSLQQKKTLENINI